MDDFLEKKHVDVPFAKPCSGHMLALLAVVNSENAWPLARPEDLHDSRGDYARNFLKSTT